MEYIYVTAKSYPSKGADYIYVRQLCRALAAELGERFALVVHRVGEDLADIQTLDYPHVYRSRSLSIFRHLLREVRRGGAYEDTRWFLSNDAHIILVLGAVRILTRARFGICFDPHLLHRSWKDRWALAFADRVITTSDMLADHVRTYRSTGVHVCYGGVDPAPFSRARQYPQHELRTELDLPEQKVLIGYAGGFTSVGREKGLDTLVRTTLLLPSDYHVLLVGGVEPYLSTYRTLAAEIDVGDRCTIRPQQDQETLARYQVACDVLVIPYPDEPHFRDFGFPMKVFEYLAAGVPVVYARLPVMETFLNDKAVSYQPGSTEDLARAIGVARTTPPQRVSIESYTWTAKAHRFLELLRGDGVDIDPRERK